MTSPATRDASAVRQAFGCGDALACTIAALGRDSAHGAGQLLWPREHPDETVLLTLGRAVELAYGRDGTVMVLHAIATGEFFGSIVGSEGHVAAQVEALSDGRGMRFSSAAMIRLMESYPLVALAIARHLSARLEALRQRMIETVMVSASGRVAAELLRMSHAAPDRVIRPVPVWSELAVIVQSTRETVSRTVSGLEKRGVLRRVEGGLAVTAPNRLEELVY